MHAIVIDKFGQAGSMRVMPDPQVGPNAVVVRVTFAGVNPIDWKVRAGEAGERTFPLVLGQDFAGVVESAGAGLSRVKAGDRVFGCTREHGAFCEKTLVPDGIHRSPFTIIPQGVEDAQAAALPTPALTALASLDILGVDSSTELLVIGAAGAVGGGAVQMARERGARVTAVVRPGQGATASEFGATLVVEVTGDIVEAVQRVHPAPYAAVLDLVSPGDVLKKNAPLYASGGKFVTTIHDADEKWFHEHGVEAVNVVMNQTDASSPHGLDTVANLVRAGKLRVSVAERPLSEAAAVLDQMQAGKSSGKIVLRT
jgi:NADPH:quinone reductase-like Zn-dependent oxidoreductase